MKDHINRKFYKEQWFFDAVWGRIQTAIIVTDMDEKILFVNKAVENLFGYSREELLGKHPIILNAEEDRDRVKASVSETLAEGKIWHKIVRGRKKEGNIFMLDLKIEALLNEDDELIVLLGFLQDVSEIERAREEELFSESRYLSIFHTAPTAVIFADKDKIIIDCNDQVAELLGYTKEEIIGTSFEMWVHPSFYNKSDLHMQKLIDGKDFEGEEYQFVKKNGEIIDASINCTSVRDKNNKFLHTLCFLQNITDRKRTEESLKEIADELKQSNEELEEFAYVASHDLQEPLRVVSNYCQLLQKKCKSCQHTDSETNRWLMYTINATARMKKLIEELLDFSRVGRKDSPFEKIDLKSLMKEIHSDFELSIKETDAKIIVEKEMPEIFGIHFRIRQLLSNLISNALKFKSEKPPVIRIGCYPEDDYWLFYVKDNGIGINPEYFDRVFGIFKRLYSREEYPGTGIGLALCKRIVETHGGRIWVDSTAIEGTYMYFTIPKSVDLDNR